MEPDALICPVCMESETCIQLKCHHLLCQECFSKWRVSQFQNHRNFDCPICKHVEIEYVAVTVNNSPTQVNIPTQMSILTAQSYHLLFKRLGTMLLMWFLVTGTIILLLAAFRPPS